MAKIGDRTMIKLAETGREYVGVVASFTRMRAARRRLMSIYHRYQSFTMITPETYVNNLLLVEVQAPPTGCVVECGVWRGGMSGGMADILGGTRFHYLMDSYEGLPPVQEIDGPAAVAYQADKTSPGYLDNCAADRSFAERAMSLSSARGYELVRGWFSDTLPSFVPREPIAVLRLDGDWYESTMTCLVNLYDHVVEGGLIIFDDYYIYDGCSRAVHEFLAERKVPAKIQGDRDYAIAYLIKPGIDGQLRPRPKPALDTVGAL
jgi:O-methyltransferase